MPDLLEKPLVQEKTSQGDEERFAHYVLKNQIIDSSVNGIPIVALCGKTWIPQRDPNKFPVCPECQAIYDTKE